MAKYNIYLVCNDYVEEAKNFLSQFFEEKKDRYSHPNWVTFVIPDSDFQINLMKGPDQPLSQNIILEIGFESKEELEEFAKQNNVEVKSFLVTEVEKPYMYNYAEIPGPRGICKIESFYCEDKK